MRLAERRGVLQGSHLSLVQEWAVEMLTLIDRRERAETYASDLKSRLVAAHPQSAKWIFPEWYSEAAFEEAKKADGTYDIDKIDDSQVTWDVPATATEREELDRWIRDRSTGVVSAADLEGGWT